MVERVLRLRGQVQERIWLPLSLNRQSVVRSQLCHQ